MEDVSWQGHPFYHTIKIVKIFSWLFFKNKENYIIDVFMATIFLPNIQIYRDIPQLISSYSLKIDNKDKDLKDELLLYQLIWRQLLQYLDPPVDIYILELDYKYQVSNPSEKY